MAFLCQSVHSWMCWSLNLVQPGTLQARWSLRQKKNDWSIVRQKPRVKVNGPIFHLLFKGHVIRTLRCTNIVNDIMRLNFTCYTLTLHLSHKWKRSAFIMKFTQSYLLSENFYDISLLQIWTCTELLMGQMIGKWGTDESAQRKCTCLLKDWAIAY